MSEFNCNDPAGMLGDIEAFPEQIEKAWSAVQQFPLPDGFGTCIRQVVIAGMGGSAIGGDLVAGLVQKDCSAPITVHRDYGVPAWVDRHTLLIASSHSGNTEETLSAWDAAASAGASCMAVTTGGLLAERAQAAGAPLLRFVCDTPPRAALGFSFTLIYGLMSRIGLIADPGNELAEALRLLRQAGSGWSAEIEAEDNLSKDLALACRDGIPVILGAGHLSAVARRWTTQINENAKAPAAWNEFPELNHNLVVGVERSASIENLRFLNLRSAYCNERVLKRMAVTAELMERAGLKYRDVKVPECGSRLAETLWAVWLGDYVSYYLACLYGVDPSPVEAIDYLKGRLAGN